MGAIPALMLHAAQRPFSNENRWVGLDDVERGGTSFNSSAGTDREALSIVAAVGKRPETSWNPGQSSRLAGLLLDQWDEVIPADKVTTGISFHYDGPGSQAPQCMLLAVPSQRGAQHKFWTENELVEIVKDTMDLSKVRAVDPDAMGAVDEESSDDPATSVMLPALMLPADPTRPDWARETAFNAIEDWTDALIDRENCAIFDSLALGSSLGPSYEDQASNITIASGADAALYVWRLLAAGEALTDSHIRKCVCSGDLDIVLPMGRSAGALLLRAGWVGSGTTLELYDSAGARIDLAMDLTKTCSAGLVRYPLQAVIGAQRIDITLTAPDIHRVRVTGGSGPKFVLTVGILDAA
jgi:hypothetical protein